MNIDITYKINLNLSFNNSKFIKNENNNIIFTINNDNLQNIINYKNININKLIIEQLIIPINQTNYTLNISNDNFKELTIKQKKINKLFLIIKDDANENNININNIDIDKIYIDNQYNLNKTCKINIYNNNNLKKIYINNLSLKELKIYNNNSLIHIFMCNIMLDINNFYIHNQLLRKINFNITPYYKSFLTNYLLIINSNNQKDLLKIKNIISNIIDYLKNNSFNQQLTLKINCDYNKIKIIYFKEKT